MILQEIKRYGLPCLTFPGVVCNTVARELICRLLHVPVARVEYFCVGQPSSSIVLRGEVKPGTLFLVVVIGFISNSLIGSWIAGPCALMWLELDIIDPMDMVLLWLGISIAIQAVPSVEDANLAFDDVWKLQDAPVARALLLAPSGAVLALSIFGAMGLDIIFGMLAPMLLCTLLI